MKQKTFDGKNVFYLVPTPIGNLKDISQRIIEVLSESDVIFCEDTRITAQLLNHLELKRNLYICNEQNEEEAKIQILKYLDEGLTVSLVSDRGTPLISDPGYKVVNYIVENNHYVSAIPGPTAFVPALVASGLKTMPFMFYGFLNAKSSKRKKELSLLKDYRYTIIFYEAPHRIIDTIEDIKIVFGERRISISREISKVHEEIFRGTISDVQNNLEESTIKGEFVIVVSGNEETTNYDDLSIEEHVKMHISDGLNEKESIKNVAKERKVTKSEIYKVYHQGK